MLPPAHYGRRATEEVAKRTATQWLSNPTNKMQLPSSVTAADADGDGLIDKEEFATLLAQAGGRGNVEKLFAEVDADGDGELTMEELKRLGDRNRTKFKALNN